PNPSRLRKGNALGWPFHDIFRICPRGLGRKLINGTLEVEAKKAHHKMDIMMIHGIGKRGRADWPCLWNGLEDSDGNGGGTF
ncbi:hypothetical protein, partial [Sphingobium chlorophenolicum]